MVELLIISFERVQLRQIAHSSERIRVLIAEYLSFNFESLGKERLSRLVFVLVLIDHGEIPHTQQRRKVVLAQHAPLDRYQAHIDFLGPSIVIFASVI
jgi:hypothetical protein